MPKILIAPSILNADFGKLNEEIASIEAAVDLLHIDVMDGHFVPNLSFGLGVVQCIDTKLPLDVHLMVSNPEIYIEPCQKIGTSIMTFHIEATHHPHRLIQAIREAGMRPGIALNPGTPLSSISELMTDIDFVLCMTVNPGFGGQKCISSVFDKVRTLRAQYPEIDIQVDGGINLETSHDALAAGANILVAGSAIFSTHERIKAIQCLKHI